jgi:hypothetical protein
VNKVQGAAKQGGGSAPASTRDLLPSEYRFVTAMQQVGFGSFECVRIESGELVLDPWPKTIRGVKFGSEDRSACPTPPADFQLKRQVVELFEYVREVDEGEIRCLEIRHGIPFSMDVEVTGTSITVAEGGSRG